MPRVPIPLVGPTYQDRSLPVSAQVTKNLFPAVHQEGREITSFLGSPGSKLFASGMTGADRGMYKFSGVLYRVSGSTLYSVATDGTPTSIGTITGSEQCTFADDGSELVITTGGGTAYTYTATGGLSSNSNISGANSVAYMTSRFVSDSTGGTFKQSNLNDSTTNAATSTAESSPDNLIRVYGYDELIYLFGDETTEVWTASGLSGAPFIKIKNANQQTGIAGYSAVASNGTGIYYLSDKKVPYLLKGVSQKALGDSAIGQAFENLTTISDCKVVCFTIDQQNFAAFIFPTDNKTYCFHEASGAWFELSYGVTGGRHLMNSYIYCYGKHLIADYRNGNIYELDFNTFTDNGDVIHRQRNTTAIHSGLYGGGPGKVIAMSRLELVLETGLGLLSGQGSNPVVMMSYSDDGGKTWSTERMAPVGIAGEYNRKVTWFGLGRFTSRIFRFTMSDPIKWAIISANADLRVGYV